MKLYGRLLLVVIVWGALAFGAVYPWGYWPLAAACAGLGLWGLRAEAPHAEWLRGLAFCLAAIAIGAGLQVIPLPPPLLLALSPATDAFLADFNLLYATHPGRHALSIAPDRTLVGLGLFAGFALFLLGLIRSVPHIRIESAVRRIVIFGVLMAVFGVVQKGFHTAGSDREVYGFWRPIAGMTNPFGPFLNRNHFAGWMVMAVGLAIGYLGGVLDRTRPGGEGWRAWLRWAAAPEASQFAAVVSAVVVMGASVVISQSRSGIASFAVAAVVVALLVPRRRSRGLFRTPVLAGAALVLGVILWTGLGTTIGRFAIASRDLQGGRVAAWEDTLRIVRDFPVLGSGLNTYGTAMLVYQTVDPAFRYREAHNDYLQLLAEGGLLLSIPALAAIVIVAREVRRRFAERRDPPMTRWIRVGATAGLVGIAIQSTMDFSLQMPGNAAFFVIVAAIAVHRPLRSRHAHPALDRERHADEWGRLGGESVS